MRIVRTALGLVVSVGAAFVACTGTSDPPIFPVSRPIGIQPSCGKPGDTVSVTVPRGDGCTPMGNGHEVTFHPGVRTLAEGNPGDGETCVMTATVPEGARTGKLEVLRNTRDPERFESQDVFTIPCPEIDASAPDGSLESGTDSSVAAGPPLNTIFVHRKFSDSTIANTATYTFPKVLTDAQRTALERAETNVKAELSPPGIPVGTCAPFEIVPPGADMPKPLYRGPLTLSAGATKVLDGIQCDPTFVYRQPYNHQQITGSNVWALGFAGDRAQEGFEIPDATAPIPTTTITSPNPATPDIDVAQAAFTIAWNVTVAKYMTIWLERSSGSPVVCVADPLAGTFTIPASFIGGPGEVMLTISTGDLRRVVIAQLAQAIMAMSVHEYAFTLHVQ